MAGEKISQGFILGESLINQIINLDGAVQKLLFASGGFTHITANGVFPLIVRQVAFLGAV